MAKSYSEKLKDPRWQKLRLEVFERDEFACTRCGDKENTLNVHHWSYAKSGNPWDSDMGELDTVCEACHKKIEDDISMMKSIVRFNPDIQWYEELEGTDYHLWNLYEGMFNQNSPVFKAAKFVFIEFWRGFKNGQNLNKKHHAKQDS
jgi:hypothetical protein